jgi:predicted nucleotidyltransferase
MLSPFITSRLDDIRLLMEKHKVSKGYIFGSAVTGNFNDSSDVDVLIEVDETLDPAELGGHLWDLQFDLEKTLGRKVDLLTSRSLRNTFFIKSVNATKELVYGR